MSYKNAQELLPEPLMKQLWEYADGELIYVPSKEKKTRWGEKSGARRLYAERNREINEQYRNGGLTVGELAGRYCLSVDSIRKIISSD
ncbi:MAG: CD3324 family protein [Firmicutes bacterium]|nr:CD3324 family protein [Bacillota bacterium]